VVVDGDGDGDVLDAVIVNATVDDHRR
jgi:hypothetical protein